MRKVFVDTVYWVAIVNPRDSLHQVAAKERRRLGEDILMVTTDEVLIEFLTAFSKDSHSAW